MRNFANHMLMTTVDTVRVNQTGMKMFGRFVPVLDSPETPLENREGKKERAAKPTITIVMSTSLRDDDLPALLAPFDTL